MPEVAGQLSKQEILLQEAKKAKELAENGLWKEITPQSFPHLAEDRWRLTVLQVQGIDVVLERMDRMRRSVRDDSSLVEKVSLAMGELHQKQLEIVQALPEPDGSAPPFPVFCWLGGDDQAALNAAVQLGIPEAIDATSIVGLMGANPKTLARLVRLAENEAARQQHSLDGESHGAGFRLQTK